MGRKALSKTPLGQRLTEVREARGYAKRADFAAHLEMNAETLGGYERGDTEPDIAFLVMYKTRFNINLDWLLTGEGEMFLDPGVNTTQRKFDNVFNPKEPVNPEILARIADVIRKAQDEVGIRKSVNSDIRPMARLYNEFVMAGGLDVSDEAAVEERLAALKQELLGMFRAGLKKPGSGKRSASSS